MTYWEAGCLLNAGMAFILGLFVFVKQRRQPAGRAFVILNLGAFIWSSAYYFWQVSKDAQSALFWCRVLTVGSSSIGAAWFHCVVHLLGRWKQMKKWVIASYVIAGLSILFIGTPLMVNRVEPLLIFPFWPKAGGLYVFSVLNVLIPPGVAAYLMFKDYSRVNQIKKHQIRVMLLATFVGFLSGASNYPQWFGVKVYPVFNGTVWLYTLIMFYAIIRYRLMEIDTVIHRTLLWMITSCLILIPLGVMLFFTRSLLHVMTWIQLTFVMTGLFYLYLFYYHHMQPRIDHIFRRRKYDYYKALGELGQKVGSELDISSVISRLFKALREILYVRNALILVQMPGQLDYSEAGRVGYENLEATGKRPGAMAALGHNSILSRYLSSRQRLLEREQVEADPQYEPVKEAVLSFMGSQGIEVLIPVVMGERVNALLGIGRKESLQAYTAKDLELLENLGRQIGITVDNALHHEDIVEKERLAQELKLGREIQVALLPQVVPLVKGLIVQGLMQPAKEIGGDYYDFITLPREDELSIVIGDVAGKGVAAGLLMAMAKTAVNTLSQEERSPRQILIRTNAILNKHIDAQKFMTLLYLRWQFDTRTLTYSSGGHEHILLFRHSTKSLESIQSGGIMLGMIPDVGMFLEEKELLLAPEDKILLYTDGVTEALDQSGQQFGLDRLREVFTGHISKPALELMNAVKDEVYSFMGSCPQYDDITLVVLEASKEV
ncbi:MAG: SpoIIE family protein phosphatase [Candidatus Omnitrophota bacterium]